MSESRRITSEAVRGDLLAGITVALIGLPQCLAYAMMAGLPPAYGLTTAAVAGLVAALLGRSAQIITGPTNTTGLLVLAALTPYLAENGLLAQGALPVLATLTVLAGLLRILVGLAGGATLLRFLPESVLVGFTAGAGILIGLMQLDEALGMPPVRGNGGLVGVVRSLGDYFAGGTLPAWPAVLTAAATAALVGLGRRLAPRWPMALLTVIAGAGAAAIFGLDASDGLPLVGDRATIPSGWPPMALPVLDLEVLRGLLLPAAAIVLLGTLELTVTARAGGARPNMRREILAQGAANTAGAFTGAFPASASLARSTLLRLGGARTRIAAAVAALAVVPILLVGGGAVGAIPQASLAGVLLVIAFRMLDRARLAKMWSAAPETRILLVVTLVATLTLPLEWAILLGAGLGLVLHLAQTSAPRMTLLRPEGDRLIPVGRGEKPEVVVVEVSGDLHYAAVTPCMERARSMIPASAKLAVLDLSHAHALRYTALEGMEALADTLRDRGTELRLAGVSEEFAELAANVESRLAITAFDPEPGASVRRALSRPPGA